MRIFHKIILVLMLLVSVSTFAVEYPKYEVRGVWLTTIGGLDWPHSYAQSAASIKKQQDELCSILDKLKRANINTVLIQTRVRATSIFQTTEESGNEPWDGCLSGFPGRSPGYDGLEFAINECHRRGMECHAWVVTIPVGKWNGYGCKTLRKKGGVNIIKIDDEGYMDPADPRVARYLARYCADITRRYDVDGINLDYIRYPESMKRLPKADVGRENISRIVREIHSAVKSIKPWVKMSCSPVGKHDDTAQYWSHGWNARSRVYQDAKEWMRQGWMDMEFPMMYFRGNNFFPFAIDWQEGSYGKTMVPGLGIYFMHPKEKNWSLMDITREMEVLRQQGMGFCFFRSKFFTDNTKGLYDFATNTFCIYPSMIPAAASKYDAPSSPTDMYVVITSDRTMIEWERAKDNSDGDYLTYNVYASEKYPVDVNDARNIVAVRYYGTAMQIASNKRMYYAVAAVDRYGKEGKACQQPSSKRRQSLHPGTYYITNYLGENDLRPTVFKDKGKKKKNKR